MGGVPRFAVALGALPVAGCALLTGASDLSVDDSLSDQAAPKDASAETRAPADASAGPPIDAGPTADGSTPLCPSFAIFCDGFEDGALAAWDSSVTKNGGKTTLVSDPVHSGARALRVSAPTTTDDGGAALAVAAAVRTRIPPVSSGLLAVRAWLFMPATLANDTTFLKVLAKNGVDDMNVKIASSGEIKVDTDTPDAGPDRIGSKPAPLHRWFCLEWRATIGAAGKQTVLLDGETILDVAEDNFTSEGYDVVEPGFTAAKGPVSQELTMDDVAIATAPIGCGG